MNFFKTALLMAAMTALLVFVGGALAGQGGVAVALVISVAMNFFSYWFSDRIVLAMYHAQEVTRADSPRLYGIVERLAQKAGLPMPKVYIIPSATPNAFATGRNPSHAAVAATEGLLKLLNEREIEGVLAHELAHVKHRDILIGSMVGTMAGAISSIAWLAKWGAVFGGFSRDDDRGGGALAMIALAIVAPIAALLIQMAVSRSREYHADARAGEITGDPLALASALQKIQAGVERIPMQEAGPATAHMFIASPLTGRQFATLFSTHPAMEDRVARLTEQARAMNRSY